MISPRMYCIVLFLCVATIGFGQQKTKDKKNTAVAHNKVKTKLMKRLIDINDTCVDRYNYDSGCYAIPYANDNRTAEMEYRLDEIEHLPLGTVLFHAAHQKHLTVYSPLLSADGMLTDSISKRDLTERYVTVLPDIYFIEDVEPRADRKVIALNFRRPKRLNIMIDITIDKETHKPANKILAVGPNVEIYGDDGVFRGNQTVFWLMYGDAQPIIASYEKTHPGCNVLEQLEDIEKGKKPSKKKK